MTLICVTDPIKSNYAQFKDDAVKGRNLAEASWVIPFNHNNTFHVTFEGKDLEGNFIPSTTFDSEVKYTTEPIDPGKVVLWLLQKVGDLICPTCGLP